MERAAGFREYLRTLPDDLLASVTQDYVWLADLDLPRAVRGDCERRRDFCRAECTARGAAELYWTAREAMRAMRKAG